MTTLKLTFLITSIYELGGTESAVATQANALAAEHDVEIVSVYRTRDVPHFPLAGGVTVRDLLDDRDGRAGGGELGRARLVPPEWDPTLDDRGDVALQEVLPGLDADVVITVTPAMLSLAARLRPEDTALVHQEHRTSSQRTSGLEALLTYAPRADVVGVLTEPMEHWLGQQLLASAPAMVVLPNALPAGFRPRSLLDEPLIVAAGRLGKEKQFPDLVEAFALVADRLPRWRLRILGDGPGRAATIATVRRLGLWDRVELPGPTTDMASEWARASIAACTSRAESFGLVIQEAMAAGVPVVSYDCPVGPRAIIDDGADGVLVPPGSVDELASALQRLAGDHQLRQRLGEAARAKAATFDAAAISARWVEVYAAAVRARRSGKSPDRPVPAAQDEAPSGGEGLGVSPDAATEAARAVVAAAGARLEDDRAVVPRARRRAFLDALAVAEVPEYLSLHDPEADGWPRRRASAAELVPHVRRGCTRRVLLEAWPIVAGAPSPLAGAGVAVEFVP